MSSTTFLSFASEAPTRTVEVGHLYVGDTIALVGDLLAVVVDFDFSRMHDAPDLVGVVTDLAGVQWYRTTDLVTAVAR